MPLIATSAGWETNPETGKPEYVVRLVAETQEDVPDLTAADVWNSTPLRLSRASEGR